MSLPTIIDRAKRFGFYDKAKRGKAHDREVSTNYAGELLQHDSSHHRWSPYAEDKWYLITTLDDFSRKILYADFLESKTSLSSYRGCGIYLPEIWHSLFLLCGQPFYLQICLR